MGNSTPNLTPVFEELKWFTNISWSSFHKAFLCPSYHWMFSTSNLVCKIQHTVFPASSTSSSPEYQAVVLNTINESVCLTSVTTCSIVVQWNIPMAKIEICNPYWSMGNTVQLAKLFAFVTRVCVLWVYCIVSTSYHGVPFSVVRELMLSTLLVLQLSHALHFSTHPFPTYPKPTSWRISWL